MTAAYLTAHSVAVLISGIWTDITADVVSSIKATWGISGSSVLDRIATVGTLSFDLNNATQKYSPNSGTFLEGWIKGAPICVTCTFDGQVHNRFYGFLEATEIESGTYGTRHVSVRCVDWMQIASQYPVVLQQAVANKRANQGVDLIVQAMPIKPHFLDLASTTDVFSVIFDVVKSKTKALTEFAKLILSDFGYLYLRHDRYYGEQLTVEGRHDRDSGRAIARIPMADAESGLLLKEDGFYLLKEDGGRIILNESKEFAFDNTMQDLEMEYGADIHNHITLRSYPRQIVASVSVLFSLNAPILVLAGQTVENVVGYYVDPLGGGTQINGDTMIVPVATTDYKMYANSDGTGTDLTSSLVVTAFYTPSAVFYTLQNTGGTDGYVTHLQARGYPLYIYNSVEQFVEDPASILQNGYLELNIDQRYTPSVVPNAGLAEILLPLEQDPKTVVRKVSFLANSSFEHMSAFLVYDVGDLIRIVENQGATDSLYFIQGVSFEITVAGIIYCVYTLRNAATLSDQYWELETAGKSELEQTTFIAY